MLVQDMNTSTHYTRRLSGHCNARLFGHINARIDRGIREVSDAYKKGGLKRSIFRL